MSNTVNRYFAFIFYTKHESRDMLRVSRARYSNRHLSAAASTVRTITSIECELFHWPWEINKTYYTLYKAHYLHRLTRFNVGPSVFLVLGYRVRQHCVFRIDAGVHCWRIGWPYGNFGCPNQKDEFTRRPLMVSLMLLLLVMLLLMAQCRRCEVRISSSQ